MSQDLKALETELVAVLAIVAPHTGKPHAGGLHGGASGAGGGGGVGVGADTRASLTAAAALRPTGGNVDRAVTKGIEKLFAKRVVVSVPVALEPVLVLVAVFKVWACVAADGFDFDLFLVRKLHVAAVY